MKITTEDITRAYEYLIQHKPFNGWALPESSEIKFKIIRSDMRMGEYDIDPHTIMVSSRSCHNWLSVLETVAHEICHMQCELLDHFKHYEHDKHFKRLARQVCTAFGWKLEEF